MEIHKNRSLKALNTFGVKANTKFYTEISDLDDIHALLEWRAQHDLPLLLLGGGSNLLFKNDFQGLIAKVCLSGKDIAEEDDEYTYVSAAAGENWHQFVRWTILQGYAGLENLSLIPGTVGAAPVQNIGAYGVELADHFHSLQAIDLESGDVYEFDKAHCQFAYRESYFKRNNNLDKLFITSVTFALPKTPRWKTDYAGIRDKLKDRQPTAELISDAIIQLRQSKLPDPVKMGNAGSFFKNPVLSREKWEALKVDYPDLPGYEQPGGLIKTSAAWLIDHCNLKGYRIGDAGVSKKHALVLVNYDQASGAEIWLLAKKIIAAIEEKYGLLLEPEPRIIV